MALADIKKSILAEGQRQAETIEKSGKDESYQIKQAWQQKIDAKKAAVLAMAQQKAQQKIQQAHFKMQSQNQAELLKRKQRIIGTVYEKALETLNALDDNQYVDLMTTLINTLPDGEGSLTSVSGKEALLKRALSKTNKKYQIGKETVAGSGGFIFTSTMVDIDNTFPNLVAAVKDKTSLTVSRTLFTSESKE